MSNAAVLSSLSREITAIADGLTRVSQRCAEPWATGELRAAHAYLAEAQFKIAIAARGVDPVIEITA